MTTPEMDPSERWIQHLRKNTKRTWACIYCPNRLIFATEESLWEHAKAQHHGQLPVHEKDHQAFLAQFAADSVQKRPNLNRNPALIPALEIRDLNELIRVRYALDVEIWSLRHCRRADRPIVEDKMRRSDAALERILGIVRAWDTLQAWDSTEDWLRMREIRQRLEMDNKRVWAEDPPWGSGSLSI
ncbi:hypothetical protein N431DRAFT_431509 [Stipitochalara longipes BDJ]|nr:hypothetical protein N431DRAFT_431509 [Stipitochalara longipes BDJ]